MALIVVLPVYEVVVGNYQAMIWWLLLPTLSPRLVGEGAYSVGVLGRIIVGVFGRIIKSDR